MNKLSKEYNAIIKANPNCKTLQSKKEFILYWLSVELKNVSDAIENWSDPEDIYKESLKIRLSRKREVQERISEINNILN